MFTYPHYTKSRHKQSLETKTANEFDPRRDLILDLHRFESMWTGTRQEMISIKENMGLGREKVLQIDVDEVVEIVASFVPLMHQRNVLTQGLEQHDAEHQKTIEYQCDRITAILKYKGKLITAFYGLCYGTALTVVNFHLAKQDSKIAFMALKCMLGRLGSRIKTVYIQEVARNSWAMEILSAFGFHIEETGSYSKMNAWASVAELKIMLKPYSHVPSGISCTINRLEHYGQDFSEPESKGMREFQASLEQFNLNFFNCFPKQDEEENRDANQFMFLVQKEEQEIVGGVLSEIEETHLHVEELWLHESMRRKKLSEKLMDLSEKYAKQKGCTTAGVETASYQAPWLYSQLGYKQVSFLTIGSSAGFHYRKCL